MRDWTKQLCSALGPALAFCALLVVFGCVATRQLQRKSPIGEKLERAWISREDLDESEGRLPTVTNHVPYVPKPPPQYLAWDNPNPPELWPYLWIEIRSTTNLSQPFRTVVWKPLGSNFVYRPATNRQEFYIARFAFVQKVGLSTWETNFSEWNTK